MGSNSKNTPDPDSLVGLADGTALLRGQFTIKSYLGSGGFGITYLADDSLGRTVVVKECFPAALVMREDDQVIPRKPGLEHQISSLVDAFVREAQNLSRLSHPGIVGVGQVFEDNGTAYISLEFIPGNDLFQYVDNLGPFEDPNRVQSLLVSLLETLQYLHAEGMLHRDISPDNIIIDPESLSPTLIDFGSSADKSRLSEEVRTSILAVKDGYSPPECYQRGEERTAASDLYALAATIYQLILGEPPVDADARIAALAAEQADPYAPLVGRAEWFDRAFLATIDRALSFDPADRFATAEDWADTAKACNAADPMMSSALGKAKRVRTAPEPKPVIVEDTADQDRARSELESTGEDWPEDTSAYEDVQQRKREPMGAVAPDGGSPFETPPAAPKKRSAAPLLATFAGAAILGIGGYVFMGADMEPAAVDPAPVQQADAPIEAQPETDIAPTRVAQTDPAPTRAQDRDTPSLVEGPLASATTPPLDLAEDKIRALLDGPMVRAPDATTYSTLGNVPLPQAAPIRVAFVGKLSGTITRNDVRPTVLAPGLRVFGGPVVAPSPDQQQQATPIAFPTSEQPLENRVFQPVGLSPNDAPQPPAIATEPPDAPVPLAEEQFKDYPFKVSMGLNLPFKLTPTDEGLTIQSTSFGAPDWATRGKVIKTVNGTPVSTMKDVRNAVLSAEADDTFGWLALFDGRLLRLQATINVVGSNGLHLASAPDGDAFSAFVVDSPYREVGQPQRGDKLILFFERQENFSTPLALVNTLNDLIRDGATSMSVFVERDSARQLVTITPSDFLR